MAECPHGLEVAGVRSWDGVPFAGPFGFCECCKVHYPYLASSMAIFDADGILRSESHSPDTHLCTDCGGVTTHTVFERDPVVAGPKYPKRPASTLPGPIRLDVREEEKP